MAITSVAFRGPPTKTEHRRRITYGELQRTQRATQHTARIFTPAGQQEWQYCRACRSRQHTKSDSRRYSATAQMAVATFADGNGAGLLNSDGSLVGSVDNYYRPSEANIQEPSRGRRWKDFLKLRGKRNEVTARDSSRGRGDNAESGVHREAQRAQPGMDCGHKRWPGKCGRAWARKFLEEVNAEILCVS